MNRMNPFLRSYLLSFLIPAFAIPVSAGCALHSRRLPAARTPGSLELGFDVSGGSVRQGGRSGTYSEIGLETRYDLDGRWAFGLDWPLAMARLTGSTRMGIGSPALEAEYATPLGAVTRLGLGAQLAFPLKGLPLLEGMTDGMAREHFMAASYASLSRSWAGMLWNGTLGTTMVFPRMATHAGMDHAGMNHGAMDPEAMDQGQAAGSAMPEPAPMDVLSLGNPHENSELSYRMAVRRELAVDRLSLILALDGQHVLGDPMVQGTERDFLIVEIDLPFTSGRITLSPHLAMPVSPDERTPWMFGLRSAMVF
ncbi:MAG: hypothetical protein JWP91_4095 [Fibrobacteres bacterium]|nr:hypothetical protein [Fibrobacterota bacterium]